MYPILARYGSIFIYSYTVVMAMGIIGGIGLINWSTRRIGLPDWVDALLVLLLAAVIGGRAGFLFSHWAYFQQQPQEAWQFWQGGLSYQTALLAGLLALAGWTFVKKRSFHRYASAFAPAFILVAIFGWAACWFEGCAYGRETIISMLSADLPDEYGVFSVRYQTQSAGVLLLSAVFLFILWHQKHQPYRYVFWMALAAVSLSHLLISLMRGDPVAAVGQVRLDTLFNAVLAAVSLLLLQYERRKSRDKLEIS